MQFISINNTSSQNMAQENVKEKISSYISAGSSKDLKRKNDQSSDGLNQIKKFKNLDVSRLNGSNNNAIVKEKDLKNKRATGEANIDDQAYAPKLPSGNSIPPGIKLIRQPSANPKPAKIQKEDIMNLLKEDLPDKVAVPKKPVENTNILLEKIPVPGVAAQKNIITFDKPSAAMDKSRNVGNVDIGNPSKSIPIVLDSKSAQSKKNMTMNKNRKSRISKSPPPLPSDENIKEKVPEYNHNQDDNDKVIKSSHAEETKENVAQTPSSEENKPSAKSENQCTQCGKSSTHIAAIINQVNALEKKLTTDINKKEELFKMEKEAWKIRETELLKSMGKGDALNENYIELEKVKKDLEKKTLEKEDQARKIVEMQESNDDLIEKYDKVQREVEHLKNLLNIKEETGHLDKVKNLDKKNLIDNINKLEDKVRKKEDIIVTQSESIVALELDIAEKDDLIQSLNNDLISKDKAIMDQEEVLLQLNEKEQMLELADEREKELNERIEQLEKKMVNKNEESEKELSDTIEENIKEIQNKDKIIFDLQQKAKETEDLLKDQQIKNLKEEESIHKITNEKTEWEVKYSKAEELKSKLQKENEDLKVENLNLKSSKESELEKLRNSLKLRLRNMIDKSKSKDNLYQQKIAELENKIRTLEK